MSTLADWLDELDLGEYAKVFAENDIDIDILPDLTDEHLKELGISLGHRLKLLKAIAASPQSQSLRSPLPEASATLAPPVTFTAERRQLTIMFVDLVGSTALSGQLDPEDLRALILAYQNAVASEITRFEGHVARYMGDGVLVYFGWPRAHEDEAERAVRAGLAVTAAVAKVKTPTDAALTARIGIATGLVVVGDLIGEGTAKEEAVIGETPNIAARLQTLAEPGTVVIGASTQRLINGLFICEDLGLKWVKGLSTPVAVYRVQKDSGVPSRFEASANRGLTPLVGREEELGLLLKRWQLVKNGEGQAVLLSGEAGIGKSRLVHDLQDRLANEVHRRIFYYGSPFHRNSAFHPVIKQLKQALQFVSDDDAEHRQDKLNAMLVELGIPEGEAVPLFLSLLSMPVDERYPPLDLTSEDLKKRTLETLARVIKATAYREPVLMIVEDLHWIDPSTLGLMSMIIDRLASMQLLLVLTHRPGFEHPWSAYNHVTALGLNRLGRRDSACMVANLTRGKRLPDGLVEQIIAGTDGVPLFLEELTKTVLESGQLEDKGDRYTTLAGSVAPMEIPASLKDSLISRLDRLGPAKELAQLAATLGRSFSHELLSAVSPLSEHDLKRGLARLVEAELVYCHGTLPAASYEFKHALVRDVAYDSLLRTSRQHYHRRIAETLEQERFCDLGRSEPEILAHHWTEADFPEKAIPLWHEAGQQAIERSANVEAISHLNKALDLLQKLPEASKRAEWEASLLIALGVPLMAIKGGAAPEVEETYRRARERCPYVGTTPQLFPSLRGVWQFCLMGGKLQAARELGKQLLALAERAQESDLMLQAHLCLGMPLFWLGEFVQSREHLQQVNRLYVPDQHRSHALVYGADPGVVSQFYEARVLWHLGFPEQALEKDNKAFDLAIKLSHLHSLAWALAFKASLHQLRRELTATREQAEATITLCSEQSFPFWLAWGFILQGWVAGIEGQGGKSIARIREGLDAYRATGAQTARPYFLALMAEVHGKVGENDEGIAVLNEALQVMDETGNRSFAAEIHRLRAELMFARSGNDWPLVENLLREAIGIAHRQQAKSLELRTASSLARLWRDQGKRQEAYELLTPVYDWFTEGFDTADLKDAKKLVDELA